MNNNATEDRSIQRMIPALEEEMARLLKDPEIAEAHAYCVDQHRAKIDALKYRTRAACALLGVSDVTLRSYSENSGIEIQRAATAVAVRLFDINTLFRLTDWRRASGLVKVPKQAGKPVFVTVDVVKGGTGKTTTAVETAIHLQFLGLRVLAIDLDVQANLTNVSATKTTSCWKRLSTSASRRRR